MHIHLQRKCMDVSCFVYTLEGVVLRARCHSMVSYIGVMDKVT